MKQLPQEFEQPRHPIGVAAERTGLSQDVIRVWERRYRAVRPERGEGGHRLYSDADIERLGLLASAIRGGRAVGQVAQLSTPALADLVEGDAKARQLHAPPVPDDDAAATIDQVLEQARALSGPEVNSLLRRAAAGLGMPRFLEQVAAPLLKRVGDEWHAGRLTPAQEHLASWTVHDLVMDTVRSLTHPDDAPRLLVATLSGDQHVTGAALAGAAAALEGWQLVYLGADLPAEEIAAAARTTGAKVVAISMVYSHSREHLLAEARRLRELLPEGVALVAGGNGAIQHRDELSRLGIQVHDRLAELLADLRRLRMG